MSKIETVALDLEQVLANAKNIAWEISSKLDSSYDNVWFGNEHPELFDEYMRASHIAWEDYWYEIPTIEENVSEWTELLSADYTVDIVTNRANVDEQVEKWLGMHDITYNRFRPFHHGKDKTELGYDVYIDDNPNMVGDARLQYLFDRPLNQEDILEELGVLGPDDVLYCDFRNDAAIHPSANDPRNQIIRVYSLEDVWLDLQSRSLESAVAI